MKNWLMSKEKVYIVIMNTVFIFFFINYYLTFLGAENNILSFTHVIQNSVHALHIFAKNKPYYQSISQEAMRELHPQQTETNTTHLYEPKMIISDAVLEYIVTATLTLNNTPHQEQNSTHTAQSVLIEDKNSVIHDAAMKHAPESGIDIMSLLQKWTHKVYQLTFFQTTNIQNNKRPEHLLP